MEVAREHVCGLVRSRNLPGQVCKTLFVALLPEVLSLLSQLPEMGLQPDIVRGLGNPPLYGFSSLMHNLKFQMPPRTYTVPNPTWGNLSCFDPQSLVFHVPDVLAASSTLGVTLVMCLDRTLSRPAVDPCQLVVTKMP